MKKILLGILVFICFINVNAKDYEIMQLIPVDEKVSVSTDHYFYHDFYFDSHENASFNNQRAIKFDSIKNLDNKDRNISFTIGFFNENKRNIGLYNYCSPDGESLKQNEEMNYSVYITNHLLPKNTKVSDIKYISIMSENPNCNSGTNFDYLGKKLEFIEFEDKAAYDYTYIKYCLYLLILILVVLVIKFVFDVTINRNSRITDKILGITPRDKRTNEEIRDEYFKRREEENIRNKKKEDKKEIKDISQEKGNTDLHNMYK